MTKSEKENFRLVVVSNRLPFAIKKDENGSLTIKPGSGGLVTALAPVLNNRGGVWIGWPGIVDETKERLKQLLDDNEKEQGFLFFPVILSKKDISLYYDGFSNEIIWPLFHDLQSECNFVPEYWDAYQQVNGKFADVVFQAAFPNDFIWVHDYHLMLLGDELRKRAMPQKLGFFLHIPFPPLDIFLKLPWRFQIIRALLQYNVIGFQTMRDKRNFIHCIRTLFKGAKVSSNRSVHTCTIEDRTVRVGAFPISIDTHEFENIARSTEVAEGIKSLKQLNQKLIFSVDRLDYTKGIIFRLEAIRRFLINYPEFHQKVQFIQLVVPSRAEIPKYYALKEEINRLVGEINGQMTQGNWVPIHHLYRTFDRKELVIHYRASDVMLITPVKDGMNLVAKEYIASNVDEKGVLILSEFAGAAAQLYQKAILINPHHILELSEAIHKALTISENEASRRMKKMRRDLKKNNIFLWVETFLNAAISQNLKDYPIDQEYIPTEKK